MPLSVRAAVWLPAEAAQQPAKKTLAQWLSTCAVGFLFGFAAGLVFWLA